MCELDRRRTLTIWVAGAPRSSWPVVTDRGGVVSVRVDGKLEGGTRLSVEVPAGARSIAMSDERGGSQWSLAIGEAKQHEDIDKLLALGRGGKYAEALAGLEALRARAPAEDRGPADAAMARMALALGEVERAEPAFRASIARAKGEGRIHDVVKDSAGLLWALVHLQQRYADARALLADMTRFAELYPEGRVWLDYHAGLLASDTADVRTALEKYRAAQRGARRLGLDSMADEATMEVARLLTRLGRAEEAVGLLRALAVPADSCARATRALNLAWALMERASARLARDDGGSADDPDEASAIAGAGDATRECPDPHRRLLAVIYAAERALDAHDDAAASRLVRELESAAPETDLLRASRRAEVLGRWLLRQGKPAAALAAFDGELPSARAAGLLEEAFRAETGAGRALLALGRRSAAVARLTTARTLLESMLRGIPLGEGRGSFLGGHDAGVRYLVQALIDVGAVREALRTARWARAAELVHAARLDRLAHLAPDARRRWDEALGRYQRIRSAIEQGVQSDWALPRSELAGRRSERQATAEQARAALDDAYRLLIEGSAAEGSGPRDSTLPDPGPAEVFLTFFPGPERWLAFAATSVGVEVRQVDAADFSSEDRAGKLLARFAARLAAARRVRLFPYGVADRVDWQAVPWRGRPLLASVQVEYGLDVGARNNPTLAARSIRAPAPAPTPTPTSTSTSTSTPTPTPTPRAPTTTLPPELPLLTPTAAEQGATRAALVVANPTGDLPATLPEAADVARALDGWNVTTLAGSEATRAATLAALPRARLFHYAGHAELAGPQALSSALLLSGGARLELGDLLAAPSVPALVFLSACEAAGTTRPGGQPGLMGLAQAFVAAGSQIAIAPVRAIGDEDARAFVAEFYATLVRPSGRSTGDGPPIAGAEALGNVRRAFRGALLATLARGRARAPAAAREARRRDPSGWESFRLLVP